MKTYAVSYTNKLGQITSVATFRAQNIKEAKQLAQLHKEKSWGKVKTEVRHMAYYTTSTKK